MSGSANAPGTGPGTVEVMEDPIDLSTVRNAGEVLARTPNGREVAELAEKLGLLTQNALAGTSARRGFKDQVSRLAPAQLSDEQSHWAGEFGRIVELIGLLQGQEKYLALRAKSARAQARSRARRNHEAENPEAKVKLTATQLGDLAEEDPAVRDIEEQAALLTILLASANAAKEATVMYLQVLSREISFRCAQMEARVY